MMAHCRSWLLAAALPALLTPAAAQPGGARTKVVLYKDRIAAQWDTVNCVKNVFKLNPLIFLRGEIPLYYERALSPRLSAELGAGITTRNYLGGGFAGDLADDFGAGTKILNRPALHAGFRWYFTHDLEPVGFYTQVEFAYLDHAKDIFMKDSTGHVGTNSLRDRRLYNDVRLYGGFQSLSPSSNWLVDVYAGVGFRNRSITRVKEHMDLHDRSWQYTVTEEHDNVPALFLGVKLGYGF